MADMTLPEGSLPARVAALSAPARQFHRALLCSFLILGHAPTAAELREPARIAGGAVAALLGELVRHDVVQREIDGSLRAAYPFSGRPTVHRVQIEAIPITIRIHPATGEHVWSPRETVVLSNQRLESPQIAADCCCPLINAFANQAQATRWQQAHPEAALRLLSQEEAVAEARALFEFLLGDEHARVATRATSRHRL